MHNLCSYLQLYIPININNQHWVALCADITRRKLTVYNSMHSAAQDGFICDILKPMATMLPSLLALLHSLAFTNIGLSCPL